MLPHKRKKILEKHSRLAPIDEGMLKSKSKLQDIQENNQSQTDHVRDHQTSSVLPLSLKNQNKSKRVFDVPAIDHSKQRAKLEEIIQASKNSENNMPHSFGGGSLTAQNFPQINKSQAFGSKIPSQAMTFTNMKQSKNNLVSADDQKKLDLKRKKVMSHQNNKAGGHQNSQSEERTTATDSQNDSKNVLEKPKKIAVRGSQSNVRPSQRQKAEAAGNKKEQVKPQTAGSVTGKSESKWMKELVRQNYLYFVEKLNQQETRRRINILKSVRLQLKERFMKVFRLFRHKKYGEPLEQEEVKVESNALDESNQFTEEDINQIKKARKGAKRRGSQLNEQELITVMEDEEESVAESEKSVIKNKDQLEQFLVEMIEGGMIYELILLHSDNVCRVKAFLQMVILRRKFKKLRRAVSTIKVYYRYFQRKRDKKRAIQQQKDQERVQQMEQHLKTLKSQDDLLSNAALKIQQLYHRLRFKKDLKELRDKLKTLPFVCRSSYVKMQMLKLSTKSLVSETSKLRKQ
eukprot:403348036